MRGKLTDREMEVLRHMVDGRSNKETGRSLDLAEAAVKVHRKAILKKIGARNAPHAVAIALRTGIVPMEV
jgi:DNA-binding CsgD family transcriptional regulator